MHCTDAQTSHGLMVCLSLCLSVCVLITQMCLAKMGESIEMLFMG